MRKLLTILNAILKSQPHGNPLDPQHSRSGPGGPRRSEVG
jgi:hypothetical protein